jgi:hypothetical protein
VSTLALVITVRKYVGLYIYTFVPVAVLDSVLESRHARETPSRSRLRYANHPLEALPTPFSNRYMPHVPTRFCVAPVSCYSYQ